jgi:hypothetical protein
LSGVEFDDDDDTTPSMRKSSITADEEGSRMDAVLMVREQRQSTISVMGGSRYELPCIVESTELHAKEISRSSVTWYRSSFQKGRHLQDVTQWLLSEMQMACGPLVDPD